MASTNAPKKAAKKAAKKAPGSESHKAGKDTRRAYEHLGRVQSLIEILPKDAEQPIHQLIQLAQQALKSKHPKEASDLLRASEHYAFGSLKQGEPTDETLSEELLQSIEDEFDHLREKAEEHGEAENAPAAIQTIYSTLVAQANKAYQASRYRTALEFARGAEALTHVQETTAALPAGNPVKQLAS